MAFTEEQVQRYSRTILLRGVGGLGQSALLQTGVRLTQGGPALLTAAAYLAAGGTAVEGPPGLLAPGDEGFLVEASDVGQPAFSVLRRALEGHNPDAARRPLAFGTLASPPLGCEGPFPLVAVCRKADCIVVWGASGEACRRCLAEAFEGVEPPGQGPDAIQAGALAALLFQRLVLGLAPPLSGVALGAGGEMQLLPAAGCPHAQPLPAQVLAEAVRHLESCYPEEGCGVVLKGPAGMRWVPLPNAYGAWAAKDAATFPRDAKSAFVFEPSEWLALLREADRQSEVPLCVVHSHPDGRAAFSAEDRRQAAPEGEPLLPQTASLVVVVQGGRATSAVWVEWRGGQFHEAHIRLPS